MKRLVVAAFASLFIFFSCSKQDNDPPKEEQTTVTDYFPLNVGNYWVYQRSVCDSGEVNCEMQAIDSCYIDKDTLINGKTYFKYNSDGPGEQTMYMRDSGDYIVELSGEIIFTQTDSANIFNQQAIDNYEGDTIYHWYYQLTASNDVIVPAGSFDCLDMRGHFFRLQDDFKIDHNMHNCYAPKVGLIRKTGVFASNLTVIKSELIGYHIEPDGGLTP
jgi:hypothetical protein